MTLDYFDPFLVDGVGPSPNMKVAWYDGLTDRSYGPMKYALWPDFARANLNLDGSPKSLESGKDG